MKKIILLALTAVMMAGCYEVNAYQNRKPDLVGDFRLSTIEYEGCEYVVSQSYHHQRLALTHKGNCRFCAERRKQELKELVEQLKK